jgi:peptidylprolyl isomerase
MKNNKITLILLGSILVLSGCQDTTKIVNNEIKKEIEKNKQLKQRVLEGGQDLSKITGEARGLAEKVNNNKSIENKKNVTRDNSLQSKKEVLINNDKKNMDENNNLPINMKLAETCQGVILSTNMGDIEIEFFGDKAPMTVANFCTLAKDNFYDKVIFHRVIKDFMIQGGDPSGTGMGDPGYKFKDEIYNGNSNEEYTIAMANAGPNTNGSQFFINTKNNDFLNGKHTVFGRVVKGQGVVDKMEGVETGAGDRPINDLVINSTKLIMK